MKKFEEMLDALRAAATHTFQGCTPEQQMRAEEIAKEIVERANTEGIPAVAGTLIGAADMVERVVHAMGGSPR